MRSPFYLRYGKISAELQFYFHAEYFQVICSRMIIFKRLFPALSSNVLLSLPSVIACFTIYKQYHTGILKSSRFSTIEKESLNKYKVKNALT